MGYVYCCFFFEKSTCLQVLFAERTAGKFTAKFRRPKKGNKPLENSSDDSSLATDSQSSSPESFGALSTSEGSADDTPLPSLPSKPTFAVNPVTHAPVGPCMDFAQGSMPVFAPTFPKLHEFGNVSCPIFSGKAVQWPDPQKACPAPVDFSFLVETPQLAPDAPEFPELSAETLARMYPQLDSPTSDASDSESCPTTVPESDSCLLQGLQAFADTYVQEDDGTSSKFLNPEAVPQARFFVGLYTEFVAAFLLHKADLKRYIVFTHFAGCKLVLIYPQDSVDAQAMWKQAMSASEDSTLPMDFQEIEAGFSNKRIQNKQLQGIV